MSEETGVVETIAHALLRAQARMPALQKNALNDHFKNKYVPLDTILEAVLPILNEEGIVVIQMPGIEGGEPALTTTLLHAESGTSVQGTMHLVMDKDTPQGQGSGLTYARRYALQGMLGLTSEKDDDAEDAETAPRARVRRPTASSTSAPKTQIPKAAF